MTEHLSSYFTHQEGDLHFFESDFNHIGFNLSDCQFLSCFKTDETNLVRFYSQLFCTPLLMLEEKIYSKDDIEGYSDLDSFLQDEEDLTEVNITEEYCSENKILLFIPSKWDSKVKSMLTTYKKVERVFENLLPAVFIEHYSITFKDFQKQIILFADRGKYSLSFFKFYKTECGSDCDLNETVEAVKAVKSDIQAWKLDSFYKFGVGNIPKDLGILEKANNPKNDIPLSYHFSFWKHPNKQKYLELVNEFKTFDFE